MALAASTLYCEAAMTEAALSASPRFNFPSSEPFSLLVGLCILIVLGRSFLLVLEWPVNSASPVNGASVGGVWECSSGDPRWPSRDSG